MKIEVLYFEGCPNHGPAVERVKEVLKKEGLTAQIVEVKVPDQATAQMLGFLGSPSLRIDGLDVEPAARASRQYGMTCRTYSEGNRRQGVPSRELIRSAVREATTKAFPVDTCCQPPTDTTAISPEKSKRSFLLLASSVVAAIVASFCCILPIIFALTGVTVIGASAAFAEWRPYLLALTFGLLGLGFTFAYRPAKEQCEPGAVCARSNSKRSGRLMLWLATAAVIVFAAFPYFSSFIAELLLSRNTSGAAAINPEASNLQHASFVIEGMDCAACATAIENKLKTVPGVHQASVSYERNTAEIDYDPGSTSVEQLEKAIQDAGYRGLKKT